MTCCEAEFCRHDRLEHRRLACLDRDAIVEHMEEQRLIERRLAEYFGGGREDGKPAPYLSLVSEQYDNNDGAA